MTSVFTELMPTEPSHPSNRDTPQLLKCLATTIADNILPDSTMDLQFEDDQCKTPNER